jgi:hypothetical protein
MRSATDGGRRRAGGPGRAVPEAFAVVLLIAVVSLAAGGTTPADLRSILDKTDKMVGQAEHAVGGKDPGKVSLILARVDELLASFLDQSGLEALVKSFDDGRAAARGNDLQASSGAVHRASGLMAPLTDFVVLRQAAETSRAALRAADARDAPAFLAAFDRFDASIMAPVLLARVREARAAVARARQAMVRNNMPDGRARIAEVRRGLNGLIHAGALSRATYALAMGSELLQGRSVISARDQLQKGMRDLKLAAETGPDDSRPALEDARARTVEIWKRSGHALPEDAGRLAELARGVDLLRLQQPR